MNHKKRWIRAAVFFFVFLLVLMTFPFNGKPHAAQVKWGIDVSTFQGEIDWETVAPQIDFAMLRCGYGIDDPAQDDEHWEYNVKECERLEIPYGVYLYSYADSTEKAYLEAMHVLRLLKGHSPSLPVYLDLEDDSILEKCSKAQILLNARIFCQVLTDAGYRPGIYASRNWWDSILTSALYDQWNCWVAEWNYQCDIERDFSCWQYSCTGSIKGIDTDVDLNYWYGPFSKIRTSEDEEIYDPFCYHQIEEGKCVNCGKVGGVFQDTLTWVYNSEKKRLTLSGIGEIEEMEEYPWNLYLSEIQQLVVEEGVANIPSHAFSQAASLQTVTLSEELIEIGEKAFAECTALSKINFPDSLQRIGTLAFYRCSSLTQLTFGMGLEEIDVEAFSTCSSLENVIFIGKAPLIRKNAFYLDRFNGVYPEADLTYNFLFFQTYGGNIEWMNSQEYLSPSSLDKNPS